MNLEPDDIRGLISEEVHLHENEIKVEFDESTRIGVGRSWKNGIVLVLPGQPGVKDILDGNHLTFKAVTDVQLENGTLLKDISLTECHYQDLVKSDFIAISFVFSALIQRHLTSPDPAAAGKVVHAIRALFENRLVSPGLVEKEVGLIGELLVLNEAENIGELIECWHIDNGEPYDFARHDERLEVKTTRSNDRIHHFTNRQLPARTGVTIHVVSIKIEAIPVGVTLADLYWSVMARLDQESHQNKLDDICLDVLGTHPALMENIRFALESAVLGIVIRKSDEIPTPLILDGIKSMEWTAEIPEKKLAKSKSKSTLLKYFTG